MSQLSTADQGFVIPRTSRLHMSYLMEGLPADIPYNDTMRRLDPLASGIVTSALTTPPGSPSDGQAHIVSATATGVWTRYEGFIAVSSDDSPTGWLMVPAREGMRVYDQSANVLKMFRGGEWIAETTATASNPKHWVALRCHPTIDGQNYSDGEKLKWGRLVGERGDQIVKNGPTNQWDVFTVPTLGIVQYDLSVTLQTYTPVAGGQERFGVRIGFNGTQNSSDQFIDSTGNHGTNDAIRSSTTLRHKGVFVAGNGMSSLWVETIGQQRIDRQNTTLLIELLSPPDDESPSDTDRPDLIQGNYGGGSSGTAGASAL